MSDAVATQDPRLNALEQRMAGMEALGAQVGEAIESIIGNLLAFKTDDIGSLRKKLAEVEQQLSVERSARELERSAYELERTSRFHPKERRVVFVGTIYFGDNVKYAWLGFQERARAEGIDCWFLPQTADQERIVLASGAHCFPHRWAEWSEAHLHAALSAAVVVTSDHLLNPNPFAAALLAGARHVQLWHGVSIKEIGLRNLPALKHMSARMARVLATCGPFTQLVGTSAAAEPEWRRWFGFRHYAPIGYPRNDVLYREPTQGDLMNVDLDCFAEAREARAAGRRVWIYAPTFRDAHRAKWLIDAGIGRIAAELKRRGDLLIVNLHPVEQPHVDELRQVVPGVRFVAPKTDMYPLLAQSTALITDYSSVMFDYLHLDRPVVLFRPDHLDYTERSRKLFDAKLQTPPGPLVESANALLTLLARPVDSPAHAEARRALRASLYDHQDGDSAARLGDLLVQDVIAGVALP